MSTLLGPWDWRLSINAEGHRTYDLTWLVEAQHSSLGPSGSFDDPSDIINTAGLPVIGSVWSSLTFIDGADDYAFCTPEAEVTPYESKPGEFPQFYLVKTSYTTIPMTRCNDATIQNPLNEPHQLSGSWVNKRIRPFKDRNNLPYSSTTGEPLQGPQTEIDDSDWEINLSFNTATIPLATVNSLRHNLNDSTLWGLAAGKVKFSKYSFTRKLYGTCSFYYTHSMSFSIRDSWAQSLTDIGRMELGSGGSASLPDDWVVVKDRFGENIPPSILDTSGKRVVSPSQTPNVITRNPYPLGNLLLLGIPSTL